MSDLKPEMTIDWQTELKATAYKYHVLISWVAVVLNPIWIIGDYYNSPKHLEDFFLFRLSTTLLIVAGLMSRKRLQKKPEWIAFIPFVSISIQNAYMYSVMNVEEIQKHTFAYIALFIGAGMFVLWKSIYSIIIVVISLLANAFFFSIYGQLKLSEVLTNGGMLTISVALFTILLIQTRSALTKKEIIARLSLAESNLQLEEKNQIIEQKNKDIKDSINYSQRIQQAILPSLEKIDKSLTDYFILYEPKDIVSGDFYWLTCLQTTPTDSEPARDVVIIAAVDCTGHGVPGALMSIIGSTILNQSSTNPNVNTPAEALNFLNYEITKNLKSIKDGMDLSLCAIDFQRMEMQYAGANNPVYILRNNECIHLKPDKQAIGSDSPNAENKKFTNQVVRLQKGDALYLFTDGFADQFGGPNGKKLKYSMFRNLLQEIQHKPMAEQKELLKARFERWKGNLEQVDDVLVIGVKI